MLIEAVLTAIPTYFTSLFKTPNRMAKRIEKLMGDFFFRVEMMDVSVTIWWIGRMFVNQRIREFIKEE